MVALVQLGKVGGDEWLAEAASGLDEAVGVVQSFAGRGSGVENLADTNVQMLYMSLNLIKLVRAQPGCEAKIRGAASALGFCLDYSLDVAPDMGRTTGAEATTICASGSLFSRLLRLPMQQLACAWSRKCSTHSLSA